MFNHLNISATATNHAEEVKVSISMRAQTRTQVSK